MIRGCRPVAALLVVMAAATPVAAPVAAQTRLPFAGQCATGKALDPAIASLRFDAARSDEFAGTALDRSKWHNTNPLWAGRDTGRFHPSQVRVGDGQLQLSTSVNRIDKASQFLNGTIVSKATFRYGYYEARTRTAANAVTSSFWFYREEANYWTELDVHENGGTERLRNEVRTNEHVFRVPGHMGLPRRGTPVEVAMPYDIRTRWTVYGLYWTPKRIDLYVNGCLRRSIPNDVFHQDLNAVFDMEIMVDWMGSPDPTKLPAVFRIDYFRVWQ
ncbi:family 16 glycosylhydrolase [Sphingomonas sanguinis]|jgi:beta-glucanase (GH16 family)|uniref:Family 16 glycosylhydrolase n=1 Tax=Sphingomonas sanguinis TaxID=33051 RepID=A0A7Y7QYP0_9SPHN|nr:family 16 glycosylhydrolase [Sphingomonas sanguinis]MBZ6383762.1 family 16 glycosylhydrolase [Sphingomonas sanguinis]NNG49683.1 family 16 glycosylhydrolase [Sphingomonas sanguinis]NNG52758.1 family 16 glycosylhydrolase [Sphingomonas sanguinis]NVP33053.1 family 16 glycosylhydrolase [Sphingomonas sanguinis]